MSNDKETDERCINSTIEPCRSRSESPYWNGQLPHQDTSHASHSLDPQVNDGNCTSIDKANIANIQVSSTTLNEELITARKLCLQSKSAVVAMFSDARMGRAISIDQADKLVEDIARSIMRHPSAFISLARLKTATEYTYMHSVAVSALMIAVAHQLDFPEELIHQAGLAGLLHDIGKMAIPGIIINKPGKLTDDEFAVIRQHPRLGAQILRTSAPLCETVIDVCLHHHEKMDGSGYPDRLIGEQISLFSRMAAICDVYDAVTSDRPYNEAWSPAIAIQKMSGWNRHFDKTVFQAFVKSVGIYPVGSIVRLSGGAIGVVTEQNPCSLLSPKVNTFFSTSSNAYVTPSIIDLSEPTSSEKIIERITAKQYGFKNTETLWSELPA
ncbi:HD-GYP domain-containing protein [Pseudomonas kilonensis]|uniref:HD-GYP domain-containing protein n=1 Tax=Pseudomonas kilonensis TaxID=132476 RepID=UPI00209ECEE1|nr:HD-GYP domain-containing protein [Pseudomonas kilonensis]MCP1455785.1 putative nucleotidyltransferase with HDIG domain [Pseudomonas kilonensis]